MQMNDFEFKIIYIAFGPCMMCDMNGTYYLAIVVMFIIVVADVQYAQLRVVQVGRRFE